VVVELPISFRNHTVTIVGGGVSLKGFDFSRIRQPAIAVNDSAFYFDSQYLVSIDSGWHKHHDSWLDEYKGYLITHNVTHRREAFVIRLDQKESWLDSTITAAGLSGFTALALAFHMQAERVVLLGYDGGFSEGLESNFYPNKCANIGSKSYERKNKYFEWFSRYPIINVGMNSEIPWFRKVPLDSDFYNIT